MHSRFSVALFAVLISTTSACVSNDEVGPPSSTGRGSQIGPPAHAPAHGYRRRHDGYELVYDRDLGVYVVVGVRDMWFLDGTYFRISSSGQWEFSIDIEGPWRIAVGSTIPVLLHKSRHPHGGPPGLQTKRAY